MYIYLCCFLLLVFAKIEIALVRFRFSFFFFACLSYLLCSTIFTGGGAGQGGAAAEAICQIFTICAKNPSHNYNNNNKNNMNKAAVAELLFYRLVFRKFCCCFCFLI